MFIGSTPGRSRRRWEDKNKVDVQEVGCRDVDWIELVQNMSRCWELLNVP
jgi:hypothetical protein